MLELKNICTQIKDGDWIESKHQSTDGIRLIQTGNIGIGSYINKDNKAKFISEETFNELKCTEVFEGDILISRLPSPVGRACIVPKLDKRTITAVDCTIIKIKKEMCIPKYFIYYTMSDKYLNQVNRFVVGTTRARISRKNLENIKIFLPSLSKQEKIVETLDKAQELINKRKQQIKLLDELVKSRFIEMFGSQKDNKFGFKTLPEIIEDDKYALKRGPFGGSLKKSDFIKEGYLVYEQRHAIHNDFNYAKYYISKEKYDDMIIFKVKPKDLLVSCSGVTLGKIAEVPEGAKPGIINQALLKITLNQSVMNNTYFIHLFRSKEIQDKLFGFSRGSGIPNFPSMNDVKLIKFLCPPIELQNKFADFVTQVDKLKFEMEKSLKELEDNFNSLMQKAFKGELF